MASRRIEDLHLKLQPIAREFLSRADSILGINQAFITDGYRSNEEQTQLYALGRTKPGKIVTYAKAGQSPHNYGLAFDIAFRRDGSKEARWDTLLYKSLAPLAKELCLEWGGNWLFFKDRPHYQLPNWKQISKQKENMANNYKGLDLNNAESMKVAVDTWADVRDGKYISKTAHENKLSQAVSAAIDKASAKLNERIAEMTKNLGFILDKGPGEQYSDLLYEVKRLKNQSVEVLPSSGNQNCELPEKLEELGYRIDTITIKKK